MQIKPMDDRVLVEPMKAEAKTASGIYLPESAKEKPQQGKIIAVGPGQMLKDGKRAPIGVKKGDTVIYGRYAGSEIEIKGEKHMIMSANDLLGIVE